ncbi:MULTISPECIES: hypothetical protein [Thalassospira]|uniref:Uncharacterized protein n=2 Tax=Thalassospira TaxID=168934 RepID=A0A367VZZ1_9PROT|nr:MULTISPECIES: hypothetical protein [Thalassospira]MDG4721444.1 hypothetical protein [Thalassospira sp. FZY0004]RCK32296.1 hypothetical protein TH19_19595 [Thalassospira profundimaris]
MAGFWSMVGLVIKSLITGNDTSGDLSEPAHEGAQDDEPICLYAIARFDRPDTSGQGGFGASDPVVEKVSRSLLDIPESQSVLLDQLFAPNPDAVDDYQAMREAQLNVLNMGHRVDADAVFWGRKNAVGGFDLHLVSDALASSLYDLMLPLTHSFRAVDHPDIAQFLKILLAAQLVFKSRGGEQRLLQIARLATHLEDIQERVNRGEYFEMAGPGAATAYAFGVFVLTETGDRTYCASALRVLEPHIRKILGDAGEPVSEPVKTKPRASSGLLGEAVPQKDEASKELTTEDLVGLVSDFSRIDAKSTALLALYAGLVNWSLVANMKARSATLAISIWKMLERRFELSMGSPVDRALAICKMAEAMVACGKETENAKLIDSGASQYRRALAMVNNRAHAPLYAITAYGLAESIVAAAIVNDVTIPDTQVVPVFQAALKICARRDHPYIWGRTMFALATVYLTNGTVHKDTEMLSNARMGFSQAYEAFMDAGAKGAARVASGGHTRSENILSQLGHRKAIIDATGGEGAEKADAS